jgi:hypothetical protein
MLEVHVSVSLAGEPERGDLVLAHTVAIGRPPLNIEISQKDQKQLAKILRGGIQQVRVVLRALALPGSQAGARPSLLHQSHLEKNNAAAAAGVGKGPWGLAVESTSTFTGTGRLIRELLPR